MIGLCRGRQRKSPTFLSQLGLAFLSVVLFCEAASGQDVCACSPSSFGFEMDFSQTCPQEFEASPGLLDGACYVTSLSANITDFVPVEVQRISILETDEEGIPIAQSQLDGIYMDGETFVYSSISGLGGNASQIPTTLHLTITANNADGRTLFQIMAIKYSNECDVYPVLTEGDSLGWTIFTDLGTPRGELCPPAATSPPSMSPTTMTPSSLPTIQGATPVPTVIDDDSEAPTYAPSVPPSDAPSDAPSTVKDAVEGTNFPTPMSFDYEMDDEFDADFGKRGKGGKKSMKLKDRSKSKKRKSKKAKKSIVEDSADEEMPKGGLVAKKGTEVQGGKKKATKDMMMRVRTKSGTRHRRN